MRRSVRGVLFLVLIGVLFFSSGANANHSEIYFSVGVNTSDLKLGSPTIDINSGYINFSVAQANKIGVGDGINYGASNIVYISGRVSPTNYSVINATGATPSDISGQTVNNITRAFNSLFLAETGASDSSHLGTSNLSEGNYTLNLACYGDGADTDAVVVDGWDTSAENYIRIYTPVNSSEVGISQRHDGVWGNGYRINGTSGNYAVIIQEDYTEIEGIQIFVHNSNNSKGIQFGFSSDRIKISYSIIKSAGLYSGQDGIFVGAGATNVGYVYNTVIYNISGSGLKTDNALLYSYGNAILNCEDGFSSSYQDIICKNCLAFNNNNDYTNSNFHSDTDYVAYSDGSLPLATVCSNCINITGNSSSDLFVDYANSNFNLKQGSILIDLGVDLSSDGDLSFSDDIVGISRFQDGDGNGTDSWDIGAFEFVSSGDSFPTSILNFPVDTYNSSSTSIVFNCSAIDDVKLANVTLYGNWSGGWHTNESVSFSGTYNSTIFNKILPEGAYIWNCLVIDNDSQNVWGANNYSFIVDMTIPVFTAIVNQTAYDNESFFYNFDATDFGSGLDSFSIDDTTNFTINSSTGIILNITSLSINYYVVNVSVNDSAGNLNWSLWSLNVSSAPVQPDTTAPGVVINSPLNISYANTSVVFNITANDGVLVDNCSYSLDGSSNISMTNFEVDYWNATNDSMTEGIHGVNFYCFDNSSNLNSSESIFFSVDLNSPVVSLELPTNNSQETSDSTPDFVFNVSDNLASILDCTLWLDNGTPIAYGRNTSVLNGTSTTIAANNSLVNGDYYWFVNCSDGANVGGSEVWNLSVNVVNTIPTISSVSGVIYHGGNVNIDGSGFGVKFPVLPTRFEDFEPINSLRIGGTTWDDWEYSDTDDMIIQSNLSNRGSASRINQGADNPETFVPVLGMIKNTPTTDQEFYHFQKNYYDWSGTWVPDGINHKVIRVWSENGAGSQPDFVGNYPINSVTVEGATGCSQNINGAYPLMNSYQDEWFSWEYYIGQNSAPAVCDGTLRIYLNNNERVNRVDYGYEDSDTTGLLKTYGVEWSQDGNHPSGTAYTYVDDLYIDLDSYAHIIMGDEDTLVASANREIQIPYNWSDAEINITVNQGSFANGSTAYLFVVDSDGNVSDGYPITFAESGVDSISPTTTLNSPANGNSTTNQTVIFNCSATDNVNLANITLYGNWSGGWHANESVNVFGTSNSTTFTKTLPIGNYIWNCLAFDNESNSGWGAINYTLSITTPDTTYPIPTIIYPTNTSYTTHRTELNYTYAEINCDSAWYSNDSGVNNYSVQSCGTNFTGLLSSEGSNTWTLYMNDTSGNENSTSVTYFVDSLAPTVMINQPQQQNYSSLSVNITLNEAGYCEYSLGSDNVTMTNNGNVDFAHTNSSIADGIYTLSAYCNDSLGNKNYTETMMFEIDSTAPTFDSLRNITHLVNTSFLQNMTATDNLGITYVLNDSSVFNVSHQGQITNITALDLITVYSLNLTATDSLGNLNSSVFWISVSSIMASEFDGNTTDFGNVTINNITNLVLEVLSGGRLNFSEVVNLSLGANLDSYVNISNNRIEINSSALPALNRSARLYLYGLGFTNPRPLKDGSFCSACTEISYSDGTFVFDVGSFSVYSAEETPAVCGDGTCNGAESCSTCVADCGACSSSGGGGGGGSSVVEVVNESVNESVVNLSSDVNASEDFLVEDEVVGSDSEDIDRFVEVGGWSGSFGRWALGALVLSVFIFLVVKWMKRNKVKGAENKKAIKK